MQRLKSRLAPLTVFTLVFTLLLAACGPTGQQGSTPTSVPTAVTEQPTATTAMEEPTATTGAEGPTATAAGTSGETSSDSGTLTVLDWAGYDAPDFWTDFQTSHPNVTVNFEIGASDADIYSKMKAGNQSDVFHPYTGWLQFFVDDGLVEEIDTSKLTNWDKVPDSFKEIGQIDGKQYFVPWDWGFTSILYRTDKIPEGVDSWSALLDPKYKGHISMWDEGPGAVAVSSYIHGWDQTKLTDEQLAQAKAEWTAQRDLNLFYWTGEPELVDAMAKGDVWLAYAWQGAYAQLLSQGVPVAYADPKEGRNSWVGVYGIRKGTENLDLAHKFLDAKLAEATGNNVVNLFYYGHVNEDVMQGITDETLKKTFSLDDPDVLEKTNFTPNLTAEQRDARTKMWTEVKAGG